MIFVIILPQTLVVSVAAPPTPTWTFGRARHHWLNCGLHCRAPQLIRGLDPERHRTQHALSFTLPATFTGARAVGGARRVNASTFVLCRLAMILASRQEVSSPGLKAGDAISESHEFSLHAYCTIIPTHPPAPGQSRSQFLATSVCERPFRLNDLNRRKNVTRS